jgi:transcriptional regulator with XRE-family HTH domain
MPNEIMLGPAIAQRVATLAADAKMNQQALAEASGLSQSTISKILSGNTQDPRISNLLGLARALSCTLDVLLGVSPMPPSSGEVLARLVRLEAAFAQFLRGEIADAEALARAFEVSPSAASPASDTVGLGRRRVRKKK